MFPETVYPLLKYIHVSAVGLSLTGFLLRAWWRHRAPERLRHPLVRTLPHVNDTVLLLSGATLFALFYGSPSAHLWIVTKLTALLAYIVLGAIALRGASSRVRGIAIIGAATVFLFMVAVVLTKQAWPFA